MAGAEKRRRERHVAPEVNGLSMDGEDTRMGEIDGDAKMEDWVGKQPVEVEGSILVAELVVEYL